MNEQASRKMWKFSGTLGFFHPHPSRLRRATFPREGEGFGGEWKCVGTFHNVYEFCGFAVLFVK